MNRKKAQPRCVPFALQGCPLLCQLGFAPSPTHSPNSFGPTPVGQNYFVSWHPCGEHLVYGLFERHIGILLPKKVPKRKTCQILRKRGIFDYLLFFDFFGCNVPICLSNKPQTKCSPDGCHENAFLATF